MEVRALKKNLMIFVLITFAILLSGCEKEIEYEQDITVLEFKKSESWTDSDKVYIETDEKVLLLKRGEVNYVQHEKGNETRIVKYDRSLISFLLETDSEYEVFIPSNQVKDVSRSYAESFNSNLNITTGDTDN